MPVLLLAAAFAYLPPENALSAAARQRREVLHTVEFDCRVTGTRSDAEPISGNLRIVFDGDRCRLDDARTSPTTGHTERELKTWDGHLAKYLQVRMGLRMHSNGFIRASDERHDLIFNDWLPAFLTARPFGQPGWSVSGVPFERCRPTGETLDLVGGRAEEWTHEYKPGKVHVRLWVDPAAGNNVRRLQWERSQYRRLDINYTRHEPTGLWLPSRWNLVTNPTNGPSSTLTVTVAAVKVNHTPPNDVFDFSFPAGARVHDERTGRTFTYDEQGQEARYLDVIEPLPSSPPPSPAVPGWLPRNAAWVISAAAVLAVAAWLIIRRVRRRRES